VQAFTRITPPFGDHRLILEAPSPAERRALLLALRARKSQWRIHLHLSPYGKANKTLVYHRASLYQVHIEDRGDLLIVRAKADSATRIIVQVQSDAATVDTMLRTFLETMPKNFARQVKPWPPQ
jgi:hypothetical protein